MKYLLQSKKFRKKIYKWLMMYIGILCLVTSVVTYSRYISKAVKNDTAKVAKFNVDIYPIVESCNIDNENVDCEEQKPTQYIEYNFVVDLTQIEVKTKFQLIITPSTESGYNDKFIIDSSDEKTGLFLLKNNDIEVEALYQKQYTILENGYESFYYHTIENNDIIDPGEGRKRTYKLVIKNKYYNSDIFNPTPTTDIQKMIQIGFKATQVD